MNIPVDYRVWIKSKKVMLPVAGFCFNDPNGDVEVFMKELGHYRCWNIQKDECIVIQFTGRTLHGEKLYTGDILKVTLEWKDEIRYVEITYSNEGTCFEVDVSCMGMDYDLTTLGYALDQWENENSIVELVGNKFENSKLLEKVD